MGKTDEAELAQQAAAQEQTAGTKRNRKKNNGKMTEEEIQEIESSDVKGVRFSESPPFVKNEPFKMRDYQIRGLNWMIGSVY